MIDFSGTAEIYEKIAAEIKGYNIGVLVNNVGISYAYPELFLDVPDSDRTFAQIITLNITSVVEMTKLVLPQMKADERGVILNIASMSGAIPQPLLAIYSASKVCKLIVLVSTKKNTFLVVFLNIFRDWLNFLFHFFLQLN